MSYVHHFTIFSHDELMYWDSEMKYRGKLKTIRITETFIKKFSNDTRNGRVINEYFMNVSIPFEVKPTS